MQPILQHLFQASSLDDISRQRLESFVQEYPSFGIGHYLLSRKLKAEGAEEFSAEAQKTGLYFSNPFWLQWQLDHVVMAGAHAGRTAPELATVLEPEAAFVPESAPELAPQTVFEPESAQEPETSVEPANPVVDALVEEVAVANEAAVTEVPVMQPEAEVPVMQPEEPLAEPAEPVIAEEPRPAEVPVAEPVVANVVTVAEESYDLPSGDNLAEALSGGQPEGSSAADQLLRSIEAARAVRDSLQKINTDFDAETAVAGETLPEEPATVAGPEAASEAPILDEEVPFVLDESAQVAPASEPILDEEPPFVLDEPVAALAPEPVATESATPTPEPFAVQSTAPAPEPS
ncbi:MAG TPA: hypothetical protein VGM89_03435, partial [Puia sp.]